MDCPNRSRLSRLLAVVAGKPDFAPVCEGQVIVSRGNIVTQEIAAGEPFLDMSSWNIRIGKLGGPTLFSRIDWTQETVCGQESIQANENEVSYPHSDGQLIHWNKDTHERHAAFYKGSAAGLSAHGLLRAYASIDKASK